MFYTDRERERERERGREGGKSRFSLSPSPLIIINNRLLLVIRLPSVSQLLHRTVIAHKPLCKRVFNLKLEAGSVVPTAIIRGQITLH